MTESDVKRKGEVGETFFSLIALVEKFSVLNISDFPCCTETRTEENGSSLCQKDIIFYTMNVE